MSADAIDVDGFLLEATAVRASLDAPSRDRDAFDLMPAAVRAVIPRIYKQDGRGEKAIAFLKWFTPGSSSTWYVTEFDGDDDGQCFGLVVDQHGAEWQYIDFPTVRDLRYGPNDWLRIERDLHFTPTTIAECRAKHPHL